MAYISTVNNQQYTVTLGLPDTHSHPTSVSLLQYPPTDRGNEENRASLPTSPDVGNPNGTTSNTSSSYWGKPDGLVPSETSIPLDWQKVATFPVDTTGKITDNTSGGQYSLILAGKSYQVFARPLPAAQGQAGQGYEIFLAGRRFEVFVEDERTHLLAGLAHTRATHSAANIEAPMPGLVANVLVQPGDTVTQHQTVVVLEAMKMENDLPAPTAGTVKEVRVSKGQTVDQGEVLVTIEDLA